MVTWLVILALTGWGFWFAEHLRSGRLLKRLAVAHDQWGRETTKLKRQLEEKSRRLCRGCHGSGSLNNGADECAHCGGRGWMAM